MQKISTVGELIKLALERTKVPEAAVWISELKNHDGGRACLFGSALSAENMGPVCYGISLKVVNGLGAGSDGLEARGHEFLATIHVLAEEQGVKISIRELDKIEALKNVLKPL